MVSVTLYPNLRPATCQPLGICYHCAICIKHTGTQA